MKTDEEIEREVDGLLEGELAKRRADLRNEIAAKERHKAAMAHLDKINAPHPIERPVSAAEQAQRNKWAAEGLAREHERARKNDERFAQQEAEREQARKTYLETRRAG